jgi:hypothetical protein
MQRNMVVLCGIVSPVRVRTWRGRSGDRVGWGWIAWRGLRRGLDGVLVVRRLSVSAAGWVRL